MNSYLRADASYVAFRPYLHYTGISKHVNKTCLNLFYRFGIVPIYLSEVFISCVRLQRFLYFRGKQQDNPWTESPSENIMEDIDYNK